jgi:hypothetical protein
MTLLMKAPEIRYQRVWKEPEQESEPSPELNQKRIKVKLKISNDIKLTI